MSPTHQELSNDTTLSHFFIISCPIPFHQKLQSVYMYVCISFSSLKHARFLNYGFPLFVYSTDKNAYNNLEYVQPYRLIKAAWSMCKCLFTHIYTYGECQHRGGTGTSQPWPVQTPPYSARIQSVVGQPQCRAHHMASFRPRFGLKYSYTMYQMRV